MTLEQIKEKRKISNRLWRKNNPEKCAAIYARYRKTEKCRKKSREWNRRNMDYLIKKQRERYNNDPLFNIKKKLRRRLSMAIRAQFTSKAALTIELLGCSFQEFKEYFTKQFTEGMTWERFFAGEIHIDHLIPCAAFDLSKPEEQKKCFHYTNLQPLWATDNLSKGDKIINL